MLHFGAFIIGLAKAGFGGGLGMIVVPMWVLYFADTEPTYLVGLMLPLLIMGDVSTLFFYWRGWDRRNIVVLFPGAVVGIVLGMNLMGVLPDAEFKLLIGVAALAFGVGQALRERMVTTAFGGRTWIGFLAGVGTGTISALAHLGGLITTLYLLPQRLTNHAFVATATIIFFMINMTKVPFYITQDLLTGDIMMLALTMIPSIVVGAVLGAYLNKRIPKKQFAWIVLFFVIASGVKLIWNYAI